MQTETKQAEKTEIQHLKLKDFQVEGVNKIIHFLRTNKSCYCADEQGLGKSVMSCVVMNQIKGSPKVLIICTKSMLYTWKEEIERWSSKKRSISILARTKDVTPDSIQDPEVLITSYSVVREKSKVFSECAYKLMIIDESHRLKNHRAKQTKAVLGEKGVGGLWMKAEFRLCLSGTPMRQNVIDGYTLFSKMAPDLFGNYFEFAGRYAYARATPYAIQYIGIRNAPELKKLIRERFYFRRTKKDVLTELPDKIFTKIALGPEYLAPIPKDEKEKIEQEIFVLERELENKGHTSVMMQTIAGQRRVQGEMKVKPVAEFVEDLLEDGRPVVLFAYHRNVIANLAEELKEHNPCVFTGDTDAKTRHRYITEFQAGERNLIILQIQAGGESITLTKAADVVLAEITWDPGEVSQAIARVHRYGQEQAVNVYYFTVEGGVDNKLIETVMRKSGEFKQVVEN